MTNYDLIRKVCQKPAIEDAFEIEDTGSSYLLKHKQADMVIELMPKSESGLEAQINLMAPLSETSSPEEMIINLNRLIVYRNQLRQKGYQSSEKFDLYDGGAEIVYNFHLNSEKNLVELIKDFSLDYSRAEK